MLVEHVQQVERVEQELRQLSLGRGVAEDAKQRQGIPVVTAASTHVKSAFGELLATSPSALILGQSGDTEAEAKMWDCFAEVFEKEISHRERVGAEELSKDDKRQILADIMVWAEITQSHYDPNTTSFVTNAHDADDAFHRVGQLLKEAKERRALC